MGYYSCLEIWSNCMYQHVRRNISDKYVEFISSFLNRWLLVLNAFNYPPIENYFGFSLF